MANIAIVFAGGTGTRMNTRSKPKQFLELHGKPILVYTLEVFQHHSEIEGIILIVLEQWISYCRDLIAKYQLDKVRVITKGGDTAFASQYNGLLKAAEIYPPESIVLIHDGVRPLIDAGTISGNIASVKEHGSAITVTPAVETIMIKSDSGQIGQIIERSKVEMARAPQSFFLRDILSAHEKARKENLVFIDSASLMQHYGFTLFPVEGTPENIKITTPNDFYTFRALVDAKESSQIFGY
ncbi:MAG: 2-C-methyl-D-erythritol 4-phosphate cytidylyltransferase [Lachnospiraceae bacterium]|nr:2-C-methyl-D-erythritol 4-phosphate cytidylyltransferase [Lachnospiraceae bacterium]